MTRTKADLEREAGIKQKPGPKPKRNRKPPSPPPADPTPTPAPVEPPSIVDPPPPPSPSIPIFIPAAPSIIPATNFPNVVLPNNAEGLALFYNLMYHARGIQLPAHLYPVVMALMDSRIENLLIIIGPGSGKSMLLSVVYPAFVLGQDPTQTILAISAGELLMQGFMTTVMEWIEHDPTWLTLFPTVRPDKARGWSTERGLFVTGHAQGDPDASYLASGIQSKFLTGKHGRTLIWDDLHDAENSASVDACMRVQQRVYNQLYGRADPRGARIVAAGRRWHQEDVYGHFKQSGDFVVMELPSIRDGSDELYWDVTIPTGLVCCFNEHLVDAHAAGTPSNDGSELGLQPA